MNVTERLKRRLDERREKGLAEYGVTVDEAEERDWIQEAIDEALDLAVYLERHLLRREPQAGPPLRKDGRLCRDCNKPLDILGCPHCNADKRAILERLDPQPPPKPFTGVVDPSPQPCATAPPAPPALRGGRDR